MAQRCVCGHFQQCAVWGGGNFERGKSLILETSQKFNDLLLDNLIDCDTINGNLILRTRNEGDKITLRKRKVTKSLKKLFIEYLL